MRRVVILILNYNQHEYTLKCLESILKSDYKNFTIILIDNGSTNENYLKLKKQLPEDVRINLKRIEKNRGYVGGVNYGLEQGSKLKPGYFLIMNNDTVIDKNAISALVATAERYKQKVIATGKVYHYDEPDKLQDIGYTFKNKKLLKFNRLGLNEIDNGQYDMETERDMIDDVFWLFPAKLYSKIGGYSPYFWFNAEQKDFALRAKKVGYKLIYTPKAKLWHKGSVSIGGRDKNPRLAYWHIQSILIVSYIHLNRKYFTLFLFNIAFSILMTMVRSILDIFKGNPSTMKYLRAKISGLLYFLRWLVIRNDNNGYNPF